MRYWDRYSGITFRCPANAESASLLPRGELRIFMQDWHGFNYLFHLPDCLFNSWLICLPILQGKGHFAGVHPYA